MKAINRIGFVATRIAGTDGVSLETYKWVEVLERNGYECYAFAGELETPPERSMAEPLAHFAHPEVQALHDRLFGRTRRELADTQIIHHMTQKLKKRLYEFVGEFNLDLIIAENALAIPMHIPLGMALTELLAETAIPAIAHHHDFKWERDRFIINCVSDYLIYAFPPCLPNLRHVVINSAASRQLAFRRGISNFIIPNVFDFATPPTPSEHAQTLRRQLGFADDELMVLQPTRIVPRKRIERALELVAMMQMPKPRLVISHLAGDEGDIYEERIKEYASQLGVELIFIGELVGPSRCFGTNHDRPYTIDDVYQAADIVTYPSAYEGFGNAFLEAIYFKKPLVVNRYSIFIEDIEPLGFEVVAFEAFVTSEHVEALRRLMKPHNLGRAVEKNYQLAAEHFSYEVLEKKLLWIIETFAG